jgi:hypothetical protein
MGEEQIVQVETCGTTGEMQMPIARLQRGLIDNVSPNLKFSDAPVTLTLIKGSGPVHVIGTHASGKLALPVRTCILVGLNMSCPHLIPLITCKSIDGFS